MSLTLSIFSPERLLTKSIQVRQVILTGSEGQLEILPGHVSMVGLLETGMFEYVPLDGAEAVRGLISTGFFEVRLEEVRVFAETLELDGEIDFERARRAQVKAEQTMMDANLDEEHFKKYELKLQRSLIRQQLSEHSS
jgi:F-type H+-transporting ATPase subunit epsilon